MKEKILKYNDRQKAKRISAFAVLLCFIVVLLLSETFILTHAGHEHDRNGVQGSCVACAQIQNAENSLKQLGMVAKGALCALIILFASIAVIKSVASQTGFLTLVDLKVKLNN